MKKLLLTILLPISLILTGCIGTMGQTTQNALSVVTTTADLVYLYDYEEKQIVEFLDNATLSELELSQILEAIDQVDRSRAKLIAYKNDTLGLVRDIGQITLEYTKIKNAYLAVRHIVKNHWDEYYS